MQRSENIRSCDMTEGSKTKRLNRPRGEAGLSPFVSNCEAEACFLSGFSIAPVSCSHSSGSDMTLWFSTGIINIHTVCVTATWTYQLCSAVSTFWKNKSTLTCWIWQNVRARIRQNTAAMEKPFNWRVKQSNSDPCQATNKVKSGVFTRKVVSLSQKSRNLRVKLGF